MQFQFDVATSTANPIQAPQQPTGDSVPDLMRLLLEQQRDHLNHVRAQAQDSLSRWRNLLSRWQKDHPEFSEHCKKAYPSMEKIYVQLIVSMVEELAHQDDDAMESDFAVQEFLDRY